MKLLHVGNTILKALQGRYGAAKSQTAQSDSAAALWQNSNQFLFFIVVAGFICVLCWVVRDLTRQLK
jgi:flagellar biogenesis protein FliO